MDHTRTEKLGLLWLAALSIIGLVLIGIDAMHSKVDVNGATLIGVIATGLATFGKDIVAAIRGYSMSAQLTKVTDQLAASGPASQVPAGAAEAAQQTAAGAQRVADGIEDRTV